MNHNCQQYFYPQGNTYPYTFFCNQQPRIECTCRPVESVSTEHIIPFSTSSITYDSTALTYYSIGNGTSVSGTNDLNVVTTNSPISFLFPRFVKITKIVARFTVLSSLTLSGLSVGVRLYTASSPNNGGQMIYTHAYGQQFNTLSGSVSAGSTYTIESNLALNLVNSSLAVIFTVENTAQESVNLVFNASILYC